MLVCLSVWLVLLRGKFPTQRIAYCSKFVANWDYSFAIGIVGDAGVRGTAQQPRLYVGMILILIFAEVLGKS